MEDGESAAVFCLLKMYDGADALTPFNAFEHNKMTHSTTVIQLPLCVDVACLNFHKGAVALS